MKLIFGQQHIYSMLDAFLLGVLIIFAMGLMAACWMAIDRALASKTILECLGNAAGFMVVSTLGVLVLLFAMHLEWVIVHDAAMMTRPR